MSAVLGLATAVLVIWLLHIMTKKSSVLQKIPVPKGLPLLGNVLQLFPGKAVHLILSDWSKTCGPVYRIILLGKEIVVVNGAKEILEVLKSKGRCFAGRVNSFRANYLTENQSDMLTLDYGPDNIYRRKLLQGHISQYGQGISKHEHTAWIVSNNTINELLKNENEPINPEAVFENAWLDLCCSLLLGETLSDDQEREDLRRIIQYTDEVLSMSGNGAWLEVFPGLRSFGPGQKLQELRRLQRAIAAKWRTRAQSHPNPQNFLYNLLLIKQGSNEFKLTDENVDALAWDLILSSMLPTVTSFVALVNILAQHPDIQHKLQQEVDRNLSQGAEMPFQNRDNLPYCYATILETLRYTSVLPLGLPHKALEDTTISGFPIPKGTGVMCNLWALHHDDNIWNKQFEFQPDRFLIHTKLKDGEGASDVKVEGKIESPADDTQNATESHSRRPVAIKPENSVASGNNTRKLPVNTPTYQLLPSDHPLRSALLPFGAGPRGCSGEMIALMQMFTMLVMLMQKVEIFPANESENQPSCSPCHMRLGAVLKPPVFKARFVARENAKD